LIFKESQ